MRIRRWDDGVGGFSSFFSHRNDMPFLAFFLPGEEERGLVQRRLCSQRIVKRKTRRSRATGSGLIFAGITYFCSHIHLGEQPRRER